MTKAFSSGLAAVFAAGSILAVPAVAFAQKGPPNSGSAAKGPSYNGVSNGCIQSQAATSKNAPKNSKNQSINSCKPKTGK